MFGKIVFLAHISSVFALFDAFPPLPSDMNSLGNSFSSSSYYKSVVNDPINPSGLRLGRSGHVQEMESSLDKLVTEIEDGLYKYLCVTKGFCSSIRELVSKTNALKALPYSEKMDLASQLRNSSYESKINEIQKILSSPEATGFNGIKLSLRDSCQKIVGAHKIAKDSATSFMGYFSFMHRSNPYPEEKLNGMIDMLVDGIGSHILFIPSPFF